MNKTLDTFTDMELYKTKAELLQQALSLNQNLVAINSEIAKRERETLPVLPVEEIKE